MVQGGKMAEWKSEELELSEERNDVFELRKVLPVAMSLVDLSAIRTCIR
jgi:hypothetical protein